MLRHYILLVEREAEKTFGPDARSVADPAHDAGFSIDAYHGTSQEFTAFAIKPSQPGSSGSREAPIGFWFTDNTDTANHFAHWSGRGLGGEQVLPVRLRIRHPLVLSHYSELREIVDRFTTFQRPGYMMGSPPENIRMMGDKVDYDAIRSHLEGEGYDGIILKDVMTDAPDDNTPIDQYIVWHPQQVRSRFAAFDPAKADSPHLSETLGRI